MRSDLTLFLTISFNLFLFLNPILAGINHGFEGVTLEELQEKQCKLDTNASAAYLHDSGWSRFTYNETQGFVLVFERKAKIKIYTNEGLNYATVRIPLFKKDARTQEVLKKLEANTYVLENGGMVKVPFNGKEVFTEDFNSGWTYKNFTFPKAKAGAVLEYSYTIESPFLFNLYDWKFQHDVPVLESEYEVDIIPFYNYIINTKGTLPIKSEEPKVLAMKKRFSSYEYKETKYRWTLSNVPAFYEEDYMTAKEDYIAKMEFQLSSYQFPGKSKIDYMKSWEDLIKRLIADTDFGKYLKKLEMDLPTGISEEEDEVLIKAKKIHEYVKNNFFWNGKKSIYPDKSIKEFKSKGKGNCSVINLCLLSYFKQAGFKAYPILLSTRSNGKVDFSFPFISNFNYTAVALKLEDSYMFFDATRKNLQAGILPFECRNGKALILEKKKPKSINLTADKDLYKVVYQTNLFMDAQSGDAKAIIKVTAYDYAAYDFRKNFTKDSTDFIEDISGKSNTISKVEIRNVNNLERPFIINYVLHLPFKLTHINYINPILSGRISENPFKLPIRTYPVDFNIKRVYDYRFSMLIPEGFELTEYPESEKLKFANDQLYYNYQSHYDPDLKHLQLMNRFAIANPLIEPNYYQELKQFYSKIIEKLDGILVLKAVSEGK